MTDFVPSPPNLEILAQLQAQGLRQRFLHYFAQLASIPRGSGNTKQVSDYCVQFARKHRLRCVQDEHYNIVMYKDGTPGYQDHPTVIIQGHLDMVCVQTAQCGLDMHREGIRLKTDGRWLWADGTTLGADDGIAVAYALAILESEQIPHPPLEVVFTTDEETGMFGAHGLEPELLRGRILLNLDSEDEGLFTAGCSGGSKQTITLPVVREMGNGVQLDLRVDGLLGGHSGIMIAAGRANACKVLSGLLDRLAQRCPIRLISCGGGEKDNAIPSSAWAQILASEDAAGPIQNDIQSYLAASRRTYCAADPGLQISAARPQPVQDCSALDCASTQRLIRLIQALPDGVQAMMADIPGLPETSANLGVLRLEQSHAHICVSVRSCVKEECLALSAQIGQTAAAYGAASSASGAYPPWEYRKQSPLREVLAQVYQKTFGAPARFNVIHAGLECGIFYEKLPGLDAISFGPTILDIHTPGERFEFSSALRTWEFLLKLLAAL